ncbi:serine/threonine protein kinase [Aliiglaciecola sp. CAU 1673]|uniref:serine/threonine protein kinase n=1 Tax=Aliiglaciecola sp. CAU 1673 TaxID=3032595 RepID=UPI0023DAF644|nr:serine/threonine protein kinase [Aliiglaciecola sp. CAU 1673]MDF2179059.1 serine/threonine protein kinase [Aliiglaciecola sp. CAU 1673]
MSDFSFSTLTPDLILDAIESTGIRVESGLLALNSYENRVYQFIDEDKRRLVVKFYRPARWSKAQIQEEHDFAWELQDQEIPVVAPLRFDGQSLQEYQQYKFALFPSVGGRQFEVDNLDQLEWMGRFIGRIHAVGKSRPFEQRPALSCEEFLHESRRTLTENPLVPDGLHRAFFTVLDQVIALAQSQYRPQHLIRLHGDCHPGNILWRDGPSFVDLDDCRMGPAIQDLWMMLSGDRQQRLLQLDTLLLAYEEFCDFDSKELKLIEPLRAMRMVHYMAWLSRRWQDPAFPQAFPWFSSEKYWEQQILSLKEQLSDLHEPPLSLMP